jgi:geranylgeranyl pyrophosphate synthase
LKHQQSGAMLCTNNIKYIKLISESSRDIGTLFQIRDDLLDYGHNISKNFNKPIFQDIREGKITYPLLFAYKNSSGPDKKSLSSFLGKQDIDEKKLKQIIIKNKGIEMSLDLANTFHDQIIRKIKLINNKLIEKEMLELLSFALVRSK